MEAGVIWITGLSGVGKTTLAHALAACFENNGREPVLLDGDEIREAIADAACGHDPSARLTNAYRISRLARMLAAQRRIVLVATMSLFHEIHDWNRKNLPGYFEVHLDVPLETVRANDSKGLYAQAEHLPGVDLALELPATPDLHLCNNDFGNTAEQLAKDVYTAFLRARRTA